MKGPWSEGVPGAWLGATDKKEVAPEKRLVLGLEKRLRREQAQEKEKLLVLFLKRKVFLVFTQRQGMESTPKKEV